MPDEIRTSEAPTQDVFVDVNDLIIDLMMAADKADNASEREAYKKVIKKLTDIRNRYNAKKQSGQ